MLWRYIYSHCFAAIVVAAVVLVALFGFIEVIDALEDVGGGSYSTGEALRYAVSTLPRLLVTVLPVACVIGALAGLGGLAGRRELAAMQASGLSLFSLTTAALAAGATCALLAMAMGDQLVPPIERVAEARRASALDNRGVEARRPRWVRDGDAIARVMAPREGDSTALGEVLLYDFDENAVLHGTMRAASASWDGGAGLWQLVDVASTELARRDDGSLSATAAQVAVQEWSSAVSPAVIEVIARRPERMPLADLRRYIDYRASNGLDTRRYSLAFAQRLAYPFTTVVMVLVAVPLVVRSAARSRLSSRVAVGAAVGVVFHALDGISGLAGIVFGLSPWVAAFAMTSLFAVAGLWMLSREC